MVKVAGFTGQKKILKVKDVIKNIESKTNSTEIKKEQTLRKVAAMLSIKKMSLDELCLKMNKNYNGSMDAIGF